MTREAQIVQDLLSLGFKQFRHTSGFIGWSKENLCEVSDEWQEQPTEKKEERGIQTRHFTKIDNDVNGNPRYYVPAYLFPETMTEKQRKSAGLVKYRGKRYGAGYVVQSYNLESTCDHINETTKII